MQFDTMAIRLSSTSFLATFVCVLSITMMKAEATYFTTEIEQGILRGKNMTSRNKLPFVAYLGIPYAKPPIGELRLKSPVAAEGWSGIRNATEDALCCIQETAAADRKTVSGEEDCLYLNVYTPKGPRSTDKQYAVMVFIYGGAMKYGCSNSSIYGPQYFLDKDIVLVTLNYRVGLLGFLSHEDNIVPGNFGLKDQVLALKWVKKNIRNFGGDPDKVTLFGESAGAVSVAFHILSPASAGLFHSAISESGTALNFWSLTHKGIKKNEFEKFASSKSCWKSNLSDTLKCLQDLNAADFIYHSTEFDILNFLNYGLTFAMGIVREPEDAEDVFLTINPWNNISHPHNNVPWIIGVNSGEAGDLIDALYNTDHIGFLDWLSNMLFPSLYGYKHTTRSSDEITEKSKKFYYDEVPMAEAFKQSVDYVTDRAFLIPAIDSAMLYGGVTYFYYYAHINQFRRDKFAKRCKINYGAAHGDELGSLFDFEEVRPGKMIAVDLAVSRKMVEYWTNFAIYGTPSPPNSRLSHWNPVNSSDGMQYLRINNKNFKMESNLRKEAYEFWSKLPIDHDF